MDSQKTNPEHSAFAYASDHRYGTGLSKREYFAAMAMQGILASPPDYITVEGVPKTAVQMADLLIDALNEPKKS